MIRNIFLLIMLVFLAGVDVSQPLLNIASPEGGLPETENPKPDPYGGLEIEAASFVVMDLSDEKIVFEKNYDSERPLASLTKLVTAAVFEDEAGKILPDAVAVVPMTSGAVMQEGDDGFLVDESFTADDLLAAMLVRSSNDAAQALTGLVEKKAGSGDPAWFINQMNAFVSSIGLHKTYFLTPTGLDIDERLAGAYGTAHEVARLFSWLVKNKLKLIEPTSKTQLEIFSVQGKRHVFESSAKPIVLIPELIAAKTGYTDLAGGNLVFAFGVGPGRQFVIAVLGSSYGGRFSDAINLYEATRQYVKNP